MNVLCLMFALWMKEAGYDTRFKMVFFHLKILSVCCLLFDRKKQPTY